MKNRLVTSPLLFIACLLVLLSGCSSASAPASPAAEAGKPESTAEPKKGGTITIGYMDEPDTLDMYKSANLAAAMVGSEIGARLFYYDPETQDVKPYLAESYTISEDGKTWTFQLQSDVVFHDGTPLTAAIYKKTIERALDPETASPLGDYLFGAIQSIDAPDDKTLIFHLKKPSAQLLTNLWEPAVTQPVSLAAIEKMGADYGRNPVGVGPWKFDSWKTGESITLVRNEGYQWGTASEKNQGPPLADKLVYKFIKDSQTMIAALESGSIDIAANVSAKEMKKYKESKEVTVLERMKWGSSFLEMNTENEILQDIQVRRAVNMAINKEAIVKGVLLGEGEIAHSPLSSSLFGYDPASAEYDYKYNVEEAKKLLDAAGWVVNAQGIREKDGKPLAVELLSWDAWTRTSQLIQGMLKEIGMDVKIINLDAATVVDVAGKGSFDMALMNYTDNDPNALSLFLHSSQIGSMNHSRVHNKELDSLLEKGSATLDKDERKKIYAEIQKLVVDQAYWVPLYVEKEFFLVNNRIQGVTLEPMYGFGLQDSWVKD